MKVYVKFSLTNVVFFASLGYISRLAKCLSPSPGHATAQATSYSKPRQSFVGNGIEASD
jgi:hypothetical protein